jgi:nicotinamidase-related amidase
MDYMNQVDTNWGDFALLLVDVQKDFWTEEMVGAFPGFEKRVAELLALCRREKIDVVHLRASFRDDKADWMVRYHFLDRIPCIEGTPGVELLNCAMEQPGEMVITKNTFDGFQKPQLQEYLEKNNKRFLLIAGLVTSVCVLLTAASAAQKGYLVGLVEDCCADKPEAHVHTLSRYPFIFQRTTVAQITGNREQWLADLEKIANL